MELIIAAILENYGLLGLLLLVGTMMFLKNSSIFTKWFSLKFKSATTPMDKNFDREVLINKIQYWLNFKVDIMDIKDPGRKMIFQDVIRVKLEELLADFNEDNYTELLKYDGLTLYRHVLKSIHDQNQRCSTRFKAMGIPDICLVKYEENRRSGLEFTMKCMELIFKSKAYNSSVEKLNALYAILTAMIEVNILEVEKILDTLNGELTGIEYKGMRCG